MKRYRNISGKYIQHMNKLSNDFRFAPGERVKVIEETERYVFVECIDYQGDNIIFWTAYILPEEFKNHFKETIL